jgi:hypothetical protein
MCVICDSKFLSLLQFKTAAWDLLNGHLMNGCRRQYLRTKVRCLTMSVLWPVAVRVIQTIWCAVSCLYEQWWHSNWLCEGLVSRCSSTLGGGLDLGFVTITSTQSIGPRKFRILYVLGALCPGQKRPEHEAELSDPLFPEIYLCEASI